MLWHAHQKNIRDKYLKYSDIFLHTFWGWWIWEWLKCSVITGLQKEIRRRRWHPTLVPLPGNSHGWRSLVGCSPQGLKESDMTEQLHFHFSLSYIGEGNGNPLQCSCLENPTDGGAWWAASMGSHRVRHDWSNLAAAGAACIYFHATLKHWNFSFSISPSNE